MDGTRPSAAPVTCDFGHLKVKTACIILILAMVLTASTGHAKPMTSSVQSWEGTFVLNGTNIPISIKGLPKLTMWKYDREKGPDGGNAIGFSNQNGDMILCPKPNDQGGQPIYREYVVLQDKDSIAHIIVVYTVQGNGGWILVESYRYDGQAISLESTMLNSGKPEFQWFREDSATNSTRAVRIVK